MVVKFISAPLSNPSTQLDIVHGLRPAGRMTPFAELDALYRHIFAHVEDIVITLGVLAYTLLASLDSIKRVLYFFDITEADVESILAPLTSVLSYDTDQAKINFHHASLPDFLWDKERSQEFCICDMGTELSILWFKNATSGRFKSRVLGKYSVYDESTYSLISLLISRYQPRKAWACAISFAMQNLVLICEFQCSTTPLTKPLRRTCCRNGQDTTLRLSVGWYASSDLSPCFI